MLASSSVQVARKICSSPLRLHAGSLFSRYMLRVLRVSEEILNHISDTRKVPVTPQPRAVPAQATSEGVRRPDLPAASNFP